MKRLIIILLTIASAIAFVYFANLESLSSAIFSMPAGSLLLLLVILAANELTKALRWGYLLRSSNLPIRLVDGATTYLASQAASALPGGSMLGARLAEEHGNIRMRQAISSFVALGVSDFFAPGGIAIIAIFLTGQRPLQVIMPILTISIGFAGIAVFRSIRIAKWLSRFLSRWRLSRRFVPQEEDFWEHTALLMRRKVMVGAVAFSIVSTMLSASILWLIANAMIERNISYGDGVYAHTFSLVARQVIPIPGGIGISDASLAGVLNFIGIGLARATFIALAYRTVNLIFRTFLGLLILIARYPYLIVGPLRVSSEESEPTEAPTDQEPPSPPARRHRAVRLPRRHPGKLPRDSANHEVARHLSN
ncbi:MAG: lysylphosphatidylglycerol synthase transmembrane domain-containing protein [Nitrolancea sp.]